MNSNAMPQIRITIESMKHELITHLGLYNDELKEALEKGIDEAIQTYDFRKEIIQEMHKEIDRQINRYFSYGYGNVLIKDSVEKVLNEIFMKIPKKEKTE